MAPKRPRSSTASSSRSSKRLRTAVAEVRYDDDDDDDDDDENNDEEDDENHDDDYDDDTTSAAAANETRAAVAVPTSPGLVRRSARLSQELYRRPFLYDSFSDEEPEGDDDDGARGRGREDDEDAAPSSRRRRHDPDLESYDDDDGDDDQQVDTDEGNDDDDREQEGDDDDDDLLEDDDDDDDDDDEPQSQYYMRYQGRNLARRAVMTRTRRPPRRYLSEEEDEEDADNDNDDDDEDDRTEARHDSEGHRDTDNAADTAVARSYDLRRQLHTGANHHNHHHHHRATQRRGLDAEQQHGESEDHRSTDQHPQQQQQEEQQQQHSEDEHQQRQQPQRRHLIDELSDSTQQFDDAIGYNLRQSTRQRREAVERQRSNAKRPTKRGRKKKRSRFSSPRAKIAPNRNPSRNRRLPQRYQPAETPEPSPPSRAMPSATAGPYRPPPRHTAAQLPRYQSNFLRGAPIISSSSSSSSSSNDSSTTSSDSDSPPSSRARHGRSRLAPINASATQGADNVPIEIDRSITWESVGGLDEHIRSLKEMVLFPMLYGHIFSRFAMDPPKGVLFYGPPGTGKSLVARALANCCSQIGPNSKSISFFMRKGADCLSKWVGETERQLRMLFEEAHRLQPSIIFFDEIDGLAPVRSSRQDQIHNSIVSTLLALMDGLDNRGKVIVIGATNRIDAIDPALRRPGRFDREFAFSLPDRQARRHIIKIHTKAWDPPLSDELLSVVANRCVGYCGADIKALCTEAVLLAVRRRYPQIYTSDAKFVLDPSQIQPSLPDFLAAMHKITPTAHRSSVVHSRPLTNAEHVLLGSALERAAALLFRLFPAAASAARQSSVAAVSVLESAILPTDTNELLSSESFLEYYTRPQAYRARFLLHGNGDCGQAMVAAALLHRLEHLPVFGIDLASLVADPISRTLEEACLRVAAEARAHAPCILYIPRIELWYQHTSGVLHEALKSVLDDMPPTTPVLLFATSLVPIHSLPDELPRWFEERHALELTAPGEDSAALLFGRLLHDIEKGLVLLERQFHARHQTEQLLLAPLETEPSAAQEPAPPTVKPRKRDQIFLRELRIVLRTIVNRLLAERRFANVFTKLPTAEEAPGLYANVDDSSAPITLCTILERIDLHHYMTVSAFLADIRFMCNLYREHCCTFAPHILNRIHALEDQALSMADGIHPKLVSRCKRIAKRLAPATRSRRPPPTTPTITRASRNLSPSPSTPTSTATTATATTPRSGHSPHPHGMSCSASSSAALLRVPFTDRPIATRTSARLRGELPVSYDELTLFTVPPLRTSRRRILFAEEDSARATSTATTKSSDAARRYMDTTPSAIAIPDAQAPPAAAGTSTDGAHNTLAPHHEPAPVADMAEPAEATSTMSSMSSAPIEIAMLDAATAVREPAVFVAPQVQHDELEAFHQRLLESATKLPLAWLLRLHTEVYGVVFLWLSDVRRELVLHEELARLLQHVLSSFESASSQEEEAMYE